ncbi:hypothetical protein ACE414_11150 [Alteromonas macleodii]|jgi:hypothetical protein|uniref:hypothetical protein n=1 Tax=Alteromonas macleodii TaxID=28108 RepID=UPI003651F6E3
MFRQEENQLSGFARAKNYLIDRLGSEVSSVEKNQSLERLKQIEQELGPVVELYPMWHPLVSHYENDHAPTTLPKKENGYFGLDHTIYFRNGFITCPYVEPEKVLESVERLPHKAIASISAELITDVHFYQKSAHPVLVKCNWSIRPNATSDFIDASVAVPLMLEQLLRGWHESRYDESWDFMQSFLLGQPHGATSSHFINRQTGTVLRKLYKEIVNTGMYGSY